MIARLLLSAGTVISQTDPTSATTFGAITGAFTSAAIGTGAPRQMQFMLRLTFCARTARKSAMLPST